MSLYLESSRTRDCVDLKWPTFAARAARSSWLLHDVKARAMAAKTDILERLRACHKEAQAAIRTALEVDEADGGACLSARIAG